MKHQKEKITTKTLNKLNEIKDKKKLRNELFEELQKNAIKTEEINQYISISSGEKYDKNNHTNTVADNAKKYQKQPNKTRKVPLKNNKVSVVLYDQESTDSSESSSMEDENIKEDKDAIDENSCTYVSKINTANLNANGTIEEMKKDNLSNNIQFSNEKARYVIVNRKPEIQNQRLNLPILRQEYEIVSKIIEHNCVIICGSTGCGKTTQLPQFLYEHGYADKTATNYKSGLICITEPRRIAAINMAKRVEDELNLHNGEVGYQIRYEGTVKDNCRIKFVTDGVLLKEIEKDFILSKYSVIIIDEAHERSLFTDIIIGIVSRIIKLRQKRQIDLRLIIMSATLSTNDFTGNNLFELPPPIIEVDSRQYPVTMKFSKTTPTDYLKAAFNKVCSIIAKQPLGSILVFVATANEVRCLCEWLKLHYNQPKNKTIRSLTEHIEEDISNSDDSHGSDTQDNFKFKLTSDNFSFDLDLSSLKNNDKDINKKIEVDRKIKILPFYALLPIDQQQLVFSVDNDPSLQKCIISTNVAETSITIPNVKYVVDTGKVKNKLFDHNTGSSTYKITWCSQSSADQRMGRAGRTQSGKCFRLYSSAVYEHQFPKFSKPEIHVQPIDDVVLKLKSLGIVKVENFPFPTPPSKESIISAEKLLINLRALQCHNKGDVTNSTITNHGKIILDLGLPVRMSSFVINSIELSGDKNIIANCLLLAISLSVRELFTGQYDQVKNANTFLVSQLGDYGVLLYLVGACLHSKNQKEFCEKNKLRYQAFKEFLKLRHYVVKQLKNLFINDSKTDIFNELPLPPSQENILIMKRLFLKSFPDCIAKKMAEKDINSRKTCFYEIQTIEKNAILNESSVLAVNKPSWILYQNIITNNDSYYLQNLMEIDDTWIPHELGHLLQIESNQLNNVVYNKLVDKVQCSINCAFGIHSWPFKCNDFEFPHYLPQIYNYFAQFLLEGQVFISLKKYECNILISPKILTKDYFKLNAIASNLITTLNNNKIFNRFNLEKIFQTSQTFLLNEYIQFFPEYLHNEITLHWPPKD